MDLSPPDPGWDQEPTKVFRTLDSGWRFSFFPDHTVVWTPSSTLESPLLPGSPFSPWGFRVIHLRSRRGDKEGCFRGGSRGTGVTQEHRDTRKNIQERKKPPPYLPCLLVLTENPNPCTGHYHNKWVSNDTRSWYISWNIYNRVINRVLCTTKREKYLLLKLLKCLNESRSRSYVRSQTDRGFVRELAYRPKQVCTRVRLGGHTGRLVSPRLDELFSSSSGSLGMHVKCKETPGDVLQSRGGQWQNFEDQICQGFRSMSWTKQANMRSWLFTEVFINVRFSFKPLGELPWIYGYRRKLNTRVFVYKAIDTYVLNQQECILNNGFQTLRKHQSGRPVR